MALLAVIDADPARRMVVGVAQSSSLTATSDPPEEKFMLPIVRGSEAMHSISAVDGRGRLGIGFWVKLPDGKLTI